MVKVKFFNWKIQIGIRSYCRAIYLSEECKIRVWKCLNRKSFEYAFGNHDHEFEAWIVIESQECVKPILLNEQRLVNLSISIHHTFRYWHKPQLTVGYCHWWLSLMAYFQFMTFLRLKIGFCRKGSRSLPEITQSHNSFVTNQSNGLSIYKEAYN